MIDKENFLNLDLTDIQGFVIDILKKRPANSIKKDDLPTQILRGLGIDIRREARKKFEYRVLKVVEILREKGIITEYKSKNVRLKLNKTREFALFENPKREAPIAQKTEATANQDIDQGDLIPETGIPDLPDEIVDDEFVDSPKETPEESITDPEIERLINIFLGMNGASAGLGGRSDIDKGRYLSLLQEIKDRYAKNINIQMKLAPYRLALDVRTSSGHIPLLINLDEATGEIAVKSFLPYFENAKDEILRLFSASNNIGTIAIEEQQGQLFFSIKDSIVALQVPCAEIITRIDRIISESIHIDEIIDRYLCS